MNHSKITPDLILYNGRVITQNQRQPHARAIAVKNGRIMAVGRNDEIRRLAARRSEHINLGNRLVVPGFIDSHIHFYEWAMKRQGLKLDNIRGLGELLDLVREAAQKREKGWWITGRGWNETDWEEKSMPDRENLDRAAPENPVLLWRCDLHLAVANSKALELAGINADTPDPPEGNIARDHAGNPTGILRELAINLVRQSMPSPGPDLILEAFQESAGALHRRGVTGIHDVRLMNDKDGAPALQAFQKLDQENRLDLRTWVTLPANNLESIIGLGLRSGFGNDKLRIGHVKFFSDGGMGARTAWMIDSFLDAGFGIPLMNTEIGRAS